MVFLLVASAHAYETDQLTWREHQLVDAAPIANHAMDELLSIAVARANARTGCRGTDEEVHSVVADEIHAVTSLPVRVWSRGVLRSPGFSTYSAALERSDRVDRFAFTGREDIYGGVSAWQSVILATAGPCSTFEIGGVRTGSDKLDHFLDTGYGYWRTARRTTLEVAVERGTRTERSFYGLLTSKTFSYADLRANWDGFRFYEGLLGPDSVVRRSDDGCLEIARPFDWRAWIDSEWDEVLNPPVYTHLVEEAVLRGLDARRDEVCSARSRWDEGGWRERMLRALPSPPYVVGPAPARRDPWQLEALCDDARTLPLEASAVRPHDEVRDQRRGPARPRGSEVPTEARRTVR